MRIVVRLERKNSWIAAFSTMCSVGSVAAWLAHQPPTFHPVSRRKLKISPLLRSHPPHFLLSLIPCHTDTIGKFVILCNISILFINPFYCRHLQVTIK